MAELFSILDFDVECRPLSYLGDYTTADITVIAWSWADAGRVDCGVQTKDDRSRARMLRAFSAAYAQADMVTGHYIRGFDLPLINGSLMELGLPLLGDKLTCDTKGDLKKKKYMSASQENLAAMLGIPEPKIQMNTDRWRRANRLTPAGIAVARQRCIGDVIQHKAMRLRMLELDILSSPKVWRSSSPTSSPGYVP